MKPYRFGAALAVLAAACGSSVSPAQPAAPAVAGPPVVDAAVEVPVDAPAGPPTYTAEVTIDDREYAPTATITTDQVIRAGVATVLHVDVRFPTTPPRALAESYTGFAVEHPGPVTFTAPDGVLVDPAKIRFGSETATATPEHVAFETRLTAAAAGPVELSAKLEFALCSRAQCHVRKATLRWSLDVAP